MSRVIVLFILFSIYFVSESVKIEFPSSRYIEERTRQDAKVIDPIFRYYITSREVQFQLDANKDNLPYFLRCQGSTKSLQLLIPESAQQYLVLDKNLKTHTITAQLTNRLTKDLIGRYTCSETVKERSEETVKERFEEKSVHVFVQDPQSVFAKTQYPAVYQDTGIHFFTIPCQTTSWLSENMTILLTPSNIQASVKLFDPQIGFALINPRIPSDTNEFTCQTNLKPRQQVRIPYKQQESDEIFIAQPDLTIMKTEFVRLTCGIRYYAKDYQKQPTVYWFNNFQDLQLELISSETDRPQIENGEDVQNTSITLRGFQPDKTYRFYCVRNSDGRIYSQSRSINCTKTPSIDLQVELVGKHTNGSIHYGSDAIYNIEILTIPRQLIVPDITRDGKSLANDKRFELNLIVNREDQFFHYVLTIHRITFEDEASLNITARAFDLFNTTVIRPKITGHPVGQLAFPGAKSSSSLSWRDENPMNIYSHGISPQEQYKLACIIHHSSDLKQALDVTIRSFRCSIDNCLSDLSMKTCQSRSDDSSVGTTSTRASPFQTQFISKDSYIINDPSIGRQYICCYRQNGQLNTLAKAIVVSSNNSAMLHVDKPEFGLVIGETLNYTCEIHHAIYDDLQIIYNNGLTTYERKGSDHQWHVRGNRRSSPSEITWKLLNNDNNQRTAVRIKTKPLVRIGDHGYLQCIGLSKQPNSVPNENQTYFITVENESPLRFKNYAPAVANLARKAGDNIELDCLYSGQPKPKLIWRKGKLPLDWHDTAMKSMDDGQKIHVDRAQAADTGYYTCELNNGRGPILRRSFDLRVQGPNPKSKLGLVVSIVIIISAFLILLMLSILIAFLVKFYKIKQTVHQSIFYTTDQGSRNIDTDLPLATQLENVGLPKNFAHKHDIRTLLDYVNGNVEPEKTEDFKTLGSGQFGVVYQVRLPNAGLVAAKMLPEKIRNSGPRRDKTSKQKITDENEQMISESDAAKRKAAEMLIGEIKIMHKAGQHLNIVALKQAAYPVASVRQVLRGSSTLRDEDSFYLMELCSNGSLESLLKKFPPNSNRKPSLYHKLFEKPQLQLTVEQACEQCDLTDDDLTLIAYQVATGADYLNRLQIVHCDLAARNVLVTSRFIMKICDFGLATSTTYKNYEEQILKNEDVHLDATSGQIAAHGLTPELGQEYQRYMKGEVQSPISKSSLKADVWSFGIFLWTLFLKCRAQPYHQLRDELRRRSRVKFFFLELSQVIVDGEVLRYIDYRSEIPRPIYAIVRDCLVEEKKRPQMKQIRTFLCDLFVLSKKAFQYYEREFNRYQADNTIDGPVHLFDGVQGGREVPSFNDNEDAFNDYLQANSLSIQPITTDNYN